MRKYFLLFTFVMFLCLGYAHGVLADPSPVPSGSVVQSVVSSVGFLDKAWTFLMGTGGAVLFFCLYAACEVLANLCPNLKANSAFQLLVSGLAKAEHDNPMPLIPPQS